MTQIHLISHTHWDREWYLPFQIFRLRLVALIDKLLEILNADPEYRHFMLDGQTIVLDDYLEFRPENTEVLKRFIQDGKILIGPWHILPDEFLVSPEATVRNLLQGDRTSRRFGPKMNVGYIPDPFGHIGQMPQILNGFGMISAAFQRGLSTDTTEFWWQAPNGSRVFTAYLRDGYGNAAYLPVNDPMRCLSQVETLRDSLLPFAHSEEVLLMFGTDHMEPREQTSAAVTWLNQQLKNDRVVHSTLPAYISSASSGIEKSGRDIPMIKGEMRSSHRSPMLPGVLSARMWIKQRNHTCENLLEKWVEPFSTFAQVLQEIRPEQNGTVNSGVRSNRPQEVIRKAWRLLMECHPHDSICGCSIDQVHDEMKPRFDQVEQIGEEITRQNLQFIADQVNTQTNGEDILSLLVFNPTQFTQSGVVEAAFRPPAGLDYFYLVDEDGHEIEYEVVGQNQDEILSVDFDKDSLAVAMGYLQSGELDGRVLDSFAFRKDNHICKISLVMKGRGEPDQEVLSKALGDVQILLADPELTRYSVQLVTPKQIRIRFFATEVPGLGYLTCWIRRSVTPGESKIQNLPTNRIENEFFTLDVSPEDGSLTLVDKRTGMTFSGLNRFVDGGDRGDEYNYCPPDVDALITPYVNHVQVEKHGPLSKLLISLSMEIPESLTDDRLGRRDTITHLGIETEVSLTAGIPRVDIKTQVDNQCRDHRLRVHFRAPIQVNRAFCDGHYEVVERPLGIPVYDDSWIESPRPEQPQRLFTCISEGQAGLMISNRGLPEVEVISGGNETEIALTLLRCVGWLSRGDLNNRKGHAGPGYATPGAQMDGRWCFSYAILPFAGDWDRAYALAMNFDEPLRSAPTAIHTGLLPNTASLVQVQPEQFVVSAIKWSEEGDGVIVRGYNISSEPITVSIKPWFIPTRAFQVRLDETEITPVTGQADGTVLIECHPHEILTVKFYLPLSEIGKGSYTNWQ